MLPPLLAAWWVPLSFSHLKSALLVVSQQKADSLFAVLALTSGFHCHPVLAMKEEGVSAIVVLLRRSESTGAEILLFGARFELTDRWWPSPKYRILG